MNQSKQRNKAIIHTDGSCSNNPGPGGWAAILDGYECKVCVCGRENDSTNNRMELKAFLEALILAENEYALNSNVSIVIYTDSKYVENPINNGWIHKWILSEFKGIKNIDEVVNFIIEHIELSVTSMCKYSMYTIFYYIVNLFFQSFHINFFIFGYRSNYRYKYPFYLF